ncbi:hypothetical protein BVC93_05810 [Mycobacterium sp. MS1601]|nr:hypothetical protein BVC93_05810 [Mycobacterium sp. MS1601]
MVLAGGPPAFGDEFVVAGAGESQVIDVGESAGGPVQHRVVGLAAVAGDGAAGSGAAAVTVVEHDLL